MAPPIGSLPRDYADCPFGFDAEIRRRRGPDLNRLKPIFAAKKKNGPPPGGCFAENASSMRADFLGNNHFTCEIFTLVPLFGFCHPGIF
jgi:hypothetical protein